MRQISAMCELEKYLNESLKGKYLKAFKKYSECWNFINAETNKNFFINGFRLGAECMHEIFCKDNKTN